MSPTKFLSAARRAECSFRTIAIGSVPLLVLCFCPLVSGANPPQFTDLGTLGGSSSTAVAINRVGQIVGDAQTGDGSIHPFIWDALNGMRDLGGGAWGNASGINNVGQVVGTTAVGQIEVVEIGEVGMISATFNILRPFIWDAATGKRELESPSGAIESLAYGINDAGQVVGQVQVGGYLTVGGMFGGEWHAAVWDPANGMQMQDLGTLGGGSSAALAINASGQVIGNANTAGSHGFQGVAHGFLWDASNGMQDLGTLVGDDAFRASDINAAGMLAGGIPNEVFTWDAVYGLRVLGTLGGVQDFVLLPLFRLATALDKVALLVALSPNRAL